jgi:VWFA-related protein
MLKARPVSNPRGAQAVLFCAVILAASPALPQSASQKSQATTLRVQVPLVLEDVVVLDSRNQPVHNLKASDFTVTDDGKPVRLQSLDAHAAPTPAQQAALLASMSKAPNLGVNVFTNYTRTPPDSSLNVLLLDAVNTPITDQDHARQQILKFLDDQPADQRVAIFLLSSRLYLLQGFTSDAAVLKTAIHSKGAHVAGSALLEDAVGGDTNDGLYNSSFFACPTCPLQIARQSQEDIATSAVSERVNRTLDAFNELAHYLSALPGRKNLIWFSAAFPLFILPDYTLIYNPSSPAALYEQQLRLVDDQLARSDVAVYPVDARGVLNNPATQASHAGPAPVQNMGLGRSPFLTSESNYAQDTFEEHQALEQIAHETGGKAFYNTGDLKAAVQDAIRFGSDYYTMSYTPPSGKWDGKYHKIDVKVTESGVHLSYRRGYYADDPSLDGHGKKQLEASAMQQAMLHGAPQPSELLFDVRVIPADNTTDKLHPGAIPNAKLMQPPYRSYQLDTLLDIHRMQMARTNTGSYQGSLDLTVLIYNRDGDVVNTMTREVHFNLPPDRYADLLAHGLRGGGVIDVPVEGTYSIRVGMRDPASNLVGAVEIPVDSLKPKRAMIPASTPTPANR